MKTGRLIIFTVFALLASVGFSQPFAKPDTLCHAAYRQILALKFSSAEQLLASERKQHPENLYIDYLENYIDFLKVFISEEQPLLDSLEENKSIRLEKMEQLPDSNPYKKLMMANINLQWAFARSKFEQFFTAALETNRAYRLISSNVEEFPRFVPNDIAMGVLHIMVGLVPEQYHWILSIISMEGTVEQGKKELYNVLHKSLTENQWNYLRPEALFYLGFIELNLASDKKALQRLFPYLRNEGDENMLLNYLTVTIYMRTGQNDSALRILENIENKNGYYPFHYLDYLHAECRIRQLNPEANLYYSYYLRNFHGRNYIKDSWRKKALLAVLADDAGDYYRYMDSVLTHGYAIVDADKDAQKEAQQHLPPPNKKLLEVRFLFDGGYYQKALSELKQTDEQFLTPDENLERLYRYGRIYHCLGKTGKAIEFYKLTIKNKGKSTRYFAANAALKLGMIYEREALPDSARYYYNKCLDMDFDEYYNSIRAKAKDGLERLNEIKEQ